MSCKQEAFLVVLFVLSTVATAILIKSDHNNTDDLLSSSSSQFQDYSSDRPRLNLSTSSDKIEDLAILDHFCAKVLNQVEAVFKVDDYLLMSLDDNSGQDDNKKCCPKQRFVVYNWKSGELYRNKSIPLEDIFEILDQKMLGPLMFVSTFTVCLLEARSDCTTLNASTLIMATFRTNTQSMESKVCEDNACNSEYCFLTTRMFQMEQSSKSQLLPQFKHITVDIDWLRYRGMIQTNWNETKRVRADLACPRVATNGTVVPYLSAFSIMNRLVWQTKPGVVQLDRQHTQVSISSLLNCHNSSILPHPLKLHSPDLPSAFAWIIEQMWNTAIFVWTMARWAFYLFGIVVLCAVVWQWLQLLWCCVELDYELKTTSAPYDPFWNRLELTPQYEPEQRRWDDESEDEEEDDDELEP